MHSYIVFIRETRRNLIPPGHSACPTRSGRIQRRSVIPAFPYRCSSTGPSGRTWAEKTGVKGTEGAHRMTHHLSPGTIYST